VTARLDNETRLRDGVHLRFVRGEEKIDRSTLKNLASQHVAAGKIELDFVASLRLKALGDRSQNIGQAGRGKNLHLRRHSRRAGHPEQNRQCQDSSE